VTRKKKVSAPAHNEPPPPLDVGMLRAFQPGKTAYCGFFTNLHDLGGRILGAVSAIIDMGILPPRQYRTYTGMHDGTLHVIVAIEPHDNQEAALTQLEQECARRLNLRFGIAHIKTDEDYARFRDFIAFMHG
jgi:hypothetical protein